MVVGLLAKGMGLVLAVLIARFLGPSAMGLFALLFSIALLVEFVAPLGLQDVLIRDVAAHPHQRVRLWRQAATLAGGKPRSLSRLRRRGVRVSRAVGTSLLILAVGMPFSALALVGQSALQGMEKVLYLTWTTFVTRVASLGALLVLLLRAWASSPPSFRASCSRAAPAHSSRA